MVNSQWTDDVSGKITFIIYMIIPLSQWKDHKNVQTLIPLTQWNQPLPFEIQFLQLKYSSVENPNQESTGETGETRTSFLG